LDARRVAMRLPGHFWPLPSHAVALMVRPLPRFLVALSASVLPWGGAWAQLADVPRPDRLGDFRSARVQGHRGVYPQRQWLVVTSDPQGLNCRDAQGRVVVALAYGSVVDSDLSGPGEEAIVAVGGRPWLRLIVQPFDLLRDWRPPAQRQRPITCRVRAHADYVAPLNPDTLAPASAAPRP
jgi:hypothetical protein